MADPQPQNLPALTMMRRLAAARHRARLTQRAEQAEATEEQAVNIRAAEQLRGTAQQRGMAENIAQRTQQESAQERVGKEQEQVEQAQEQEQEEQEMAASEQVSSQADARQEMLAEQRTASEARATEEAAVQERRIRLALIFFPLLILAASKDILDLISLDVLSWIDWILDILIGILFFIGFREGKSELQATASALKRIAPMILEAIPFLGFLPIWTISVIIMGISRNAQESIGRAEGIGQWAEQRTKVRQREALRKAA